jgi:hypothetical protein
MKIIWRHGFKVTGTEKNTVSDGPESEGLTNEFEKLYYKPRKADFIF